MQMAERFNYSGRVDIRFLTYVYYRRIYFRHQVRNFIPETIPHGNVIDIGCGTGVYLDAFSDGIGVDINLNDLQLKEERFKKCDITKKLPFRDGEFDFALLIDVLEHIEKPIELLKEVNRISRYGFLAEVPTSDIIPCYYDPVNWLRRKMKKGLLPCAGIKKFGHIQIIKETEWEAVFKDAGFTIAKHGHLRKLTFFECIETILYFTFLKNIPYEAMSFKVVSGEMVRFVHRIYSLLHRFDPVMPKTVFSTWVCAKV